MTKTIAPVFVFLMATAAGAQPAPEPASVDGIVVEAMSNTPIPGAHVVLSQGLGGVADATETDQAGRFSFEGLEATPYNLSVQLDGYLRARGSPFVETIVVLLPGENPSIRRELERASVIAGRVLDDAGEPVRGVQVRASFRRYLFGVERLQSVGSQAVTDDRGEYRIYDLPPNHYLVSIDYRDRDLAPTSSPLAYPRQYYPGVDLPAQATALKVDAGAVREGIDFRLPEPVRGVRLSGRVVSGVPGVPMLDTATRIFLRKLSDPTASTPTPILSFGGKFHVTGLTPGDYMLTASMRADDALVAQHAVTVGKEDVTGIELLLLHGESVPVEVRLEGVDPLPPEYSHWNVGMLPMSFTPMSTRSARPELGRHEITGVSPDDYKVEVSGLPANAYVKSARLGDQDALRTVSIGAEPPPTLHVTVSSDGAEISGRVYDADSHPYPGATVVLIPSAASSDEMQRYARTRSDEAGRFQFTGRPPGVYRLAAVERVLVQNQEFDPAFQSALAGDFVRVELGEGEKETVDLDLHPAVMP